MTAFLLLFTSRREGPKTVRYSSFVSRTDGVTELGQKRTCAIPPMSGDLNLVVTLQELSPIFRRATCTPVDEKISSRFAPSFPQKPSTPGFLWSADQT